MIELPELNQVIEISEDASKSLGDRRRYRARRVEGRWEVYASTSLTERGSVVATCESEPIAVLLMSALEWHGRFAAYVRTTLSGDTEARAGFASGAEHLPDCPSMTPPFKGHCTCKSAVPEDRQPD